MSTRSTIRFQHAGEESITIYQQFDSYIQYTIPKLQAFMEWNKEIKSVRFTATNFIFWAKYKDMQDEAEHNGTSPEILFDGLMARIGYYITTNEHTNEQYYYVVDLEKKTITVDDHVFGFDELVTEAQLKRLDR